jgi:Tol biopolymer transport system component
MNYYIKQKNTFLLIGLVMIFLGLSYPLVSYSQSVQVANGLIAFVSDRDGDYEIYIMRSDGTDLQQLTFNNSLDLHPSWSPDGDRIAFLSSINGPGDIYIMGKDGSNLSNFTMTPNETETMPSWSPDGSQIAFSRDTANGADIYTINTDGTGLTRIVDGGDVTYNLFPTWSPDGSQIAFISTDELLAGGELGGTFHLNIFDISSGNQTELTLLDVYGNPDWSWSQDRIVYYDRSTYYTAIKFITMDTTELVILPNETFPNQALPYPRADENPSWSPDGEFIVFDANVYSDTDPNYSDRDIYVMNSDGTNVNNLTPNTTSADIQPVWQPVISLLPTCTITVATSDTNALVSTITTANGTGTSQTLCLEGTYELTSSNNSSSDGANGLPVITGNITLVGINGGATITRNAAEQFRIAKVDEDGRLVLDGITISNGLVSNQNSGGSIRNLGTLEVINSVITNNQSDAGGGIRNNDNATLIISNSTISNNTSTGNGGGVYSNTGSSTTITDSILSDNDANLSNGLGGGLFMNGATLNITGGSFTLNQARNGAAIFFNVVTGANPAQLTGVSLTNNVASNHGGAVYVSTGNVVMENVTIANNTANSIGGGIRNLATLSISNSSLRDNNGGSSNGGGIANSGTLNMTNTQILGNYGTGTTMDGGGVHNSGTFNASGVTLENNQAKDDGGGLANTGTFTFTNGTIQNNQAVDRGGGVDTATGTNTILQYNCIVGNSAPNTSAVYNSSSTSTLNAQYNWWGSSSAPTSSQVNNNVDKGNHNTVSCANALAGGGTFAAGQSTTMLPIITVAAPYESPMEDYVGWQSVGAWAQEALVGHTNGAWVADATIRNRVSSLEMNVAVNLGNNPSPRVRYWQRGILSHNDTIVLEIQPIDASTWTILDQQSKVSSDWTQREIDLSAYRGQTIRLRWRLTTTGDVTTGQSSIDYAIDDLQITSRR